MAVQNIDLWVSAGSFDKPYYRFYADSDGSQELSNLSLDINKSYTLRRLNEATSHPFYLSDTSYKTNSSNALLITGDGSPSQGIKGNESFKVEFVADSAGDIEELLYYCSSHQSMQGNIGLTEEPKYPIIRGSSIYKEVGGDNYYWSEAQEIAKKLEIDNLVYQSVDNLRKSIIEDSPIKDLEMSCFTGFYVTGTVNQEYLNWVENEYKS